MYVYMYVELYVLTRRFLVFLCFLSLFGSSLWAATRVDHSQEEVVISHRSGYTFPWGRWSCPSPCALLPVVALAVAVVVVVVVVVVIVVVAVALVVVMVAVACRAIHRGPSLRLVVDVYYAHSSGRSISDGDSGGSGGSSESSDNISGCGGVSNSNGGSRVTWERWSCPCPWAPTGVDHSLEEVAICYSLYGAGSVIPYRRWSCHVPALGLLGLIIPWIGIGHSHRSG